MKNKKILIILICVVLVILFIFKLLSKRDSGDNNLATKNPTDGESSFVLDGYPIDEVPLYKLDKISSMKYFVNDDPQNYASYFDKNKNYYNVVFYSTASQKDLLNYYKSLMSSVNTEDVRDDSVEGVIGKYKVAASHYGEDSSTAYLQVYMPTEEYSKENPYFEDFTSPFDVPQSWIEHESSYGLLNQKGGEQEYSRYFVVDKDLLDELYVSFASELAEKDGFVATDDTNTLTWTEGDSKITLVFKTDHGRVYYMEILPL